MSVRRRFTSAVLIALCALPLIAGTNRWTITGPEGGLVNKLLFDPADPSIAYAASFNGVFRSTDGGQHWVAAPELLGTPVADMAIAPSDPQKVFASTQYGLFKSKDRGATWFRVHPLASLTVAVSWTNADIVYSAGYAGPARSLNGGVSFENVGAGLPQFANTLFGIVVDPRNPDAVYFELTPLPTWAGVHVFKSLDGGATWKAATTGLTDTFYSAPAIDRSNPSTLYISGSTSLFMTNNGGSSWAKITKPETRINSFALVPGTPTLVYAATPLGLFQTANDGALWSGPFGSESASEVAVDPINHANILISNSTGILRSTNGGNTFSHANTGFTSHNTQGIATDPRNAAVVYALSETGIHKSSDFGQTWTLLTEASMRCLAVDPFVASTLYATTSAWYPSSVLRRSTDGGVTWKDFNTGLPSDGAGCAVTDPRNQGTIYTISGTSVYRKIGENDWSSRSTGLPVPAFNDDVAASATTLAIDPNNSAVLYVGLNGSIRGVYKTTDGGGTWKPAKAGISDVAPSGIAIDPFDSNHLLTWKYSDSYQSLDGGASWSRFAVLPGRQDSLLAFDPSGPGRIYSASVDGSDPAGARVDRSIDGGATWSSVETGLGRNRFDFFVVGAGGGALYGGSRVGGVWAMHIARARAVRR